MDKNFLKKNCDAIEKSIIDCEISCYENLHKIYEEIGEPFNTESYGGYQIFEKNGELFVVDKDYDTPIAIDDDRMPRGWLIEVADNVISWAWVYRIDN